MVRNQQIKRGVRTFICKDCGKRSTDEYGGFKRFDTKHDIEVEYENIDLCKKCFKRFRKNQSQFGMIQELFKKHILNEKNTKQFTTDKQFRNMLVKKHFVAHEGDLKRKNEKYIEDLRRSQQSEKSFQVLFN